MLPFVPVAFSNVHWAKTVSVPPESALLTVPPSVTVRVSAPPPACWIVPLRAPTAAPLAMRTNIVLPDKVPPEGASVWFGAKLLLSKLISNPADALSWMLPVRLPPLTV